MREAPGAKTKDGGSSIVDFMCGSVRLHWSAVRPGSSSFKLSG